MNETRSPSSFFPDYPSVFCYEFHVSRAARDKYNFDQSLFSTNGNVVLADFVAARAFADQINQKRNDKVAYADMYAVGLIDELLHLLITRFRTQNPTAFSRALETIAAKIGPDKLEQTLLTFTEQFPPVSVYQGLVSAPYYLAGQQDGRPNKEIALEEILILAISNENQAFEKFKELFDDSSLREQTAYVPLLNNLETFLEGEDGLDALGGLSLLKALRLSAKEGSLEAQLNFLLGKLSSIFPNMTFRTLTAMSVLAENQSSFKVDLAGFQGTGGGHPGLGLLDSTTAENEYEAFTQDRDWMPEVVLLAKNAFVWLDQLSKQYGREIRSLDQVPDEELRKIASWGVNGLWLIGLWERSKASRRIKHIMGKPDAVSSAYSLHSYEIANDLGGESALEALKQKANQYGIRLASDMVPNHVGIDAPLVVNQPDWFVSQNYSPYPNYTFSGEDLSDDMRVGIYLEDHYFDKTDAAVVFKRVDNWTGETRYIYHGNDGTAMPWNDTAQLNYLNPDVREAVIQTILHVARQFPIIRFDAAMTLAKRHIQRLWFPPPGGSKWGGSVPSRAEHSMTKEQFDALMPQEFWREVVDRCAVEAPDTLLLAEAFWMMEGYFVRTLGMHRVYNSAFMVMLRDEDNAGYKNIIRETLNFDPNILQRFVNFLSNPDEKTSIEQFGKDDKYFGVMTVAATMPGLPMIGHGQVEGYTEKYGMEYQRAYYDESPDLGLIQHHETQIFPLLKRRHQFSGVSNYVLYDDTPGDVFAYSNGLGAGRSLVFYNNSQTPCEALIWPSTALQLDSAPNTFSVYRDIVSGLEYIRENAKIQTSGFRQPLGGYERHVFLDWREVSDNDGRYRALADQIGNTGVANIEEELLYSKLNGVHSAFFALFSEGTIGQITDAANAKRYPKTLNQTIQALVMQIYGEIDEVFPGVHKLKPLVKVSTILRKFVRNQPKTGEALRLEANLSTLAISLKTVLGRNLFEDLRLDRLLYSVAQERGLSSEAAKRCVLTTRALSPYFPSWMRSSAKSLEAFQVKAWKKNPELAKFLGINEYQGKEFFQKESLELMTALFITMQPVVSPARSVAFDKISKVASRANYSVEKFSRLSRTIQL